MLLALVLLLYSLSFALDLKEAINSAIENSPSIKGLSAERFVYEGRRLSYRSGLNPSLSLEVGNFGTSKESFSKAPLYNFTYSQPIVYPSILRLAGEVYKVQSTALDYRIETEKNRLASEVYSLFYNALYLKELLKVMEEELVLQREIRDFVERSFKLGETTRLELLRAERELELLEGERRITEARYRGVLRELSVMVGKDIDKVEGEFTLPEWKEISLEDTPLFAYYRLGKESISKQMEVESLLAKPTYSLSLTGEKVGDREYGFRVGLTVGLPIFYKRQGELLELSAQRELLLAEEKSQKQKALAQLNSSKTQYEEIKRQVEKIQRELIPQAQKELELAFKSYKLRTITLLELSQTRKSYYDLLKRKLELLLQAHTEYAKGIAYGGSKWCGCY
ncbi:MAG: TolC family protein [Aquificaceae bacterium]